MMTVSDWSSSTIEKCCDILDSKRVPVNAEEREKRIGDIPYYGANGLQGYIDDFIFDESLILIAEDGGRFDEFATRPIAYRIYGKSWVNNHAHVLRAKKDFCEDAVFYKLEHKDIQSFIVGGTRAKLNQRALRSITISLPDSKPEQTKIADVLSTVDRAIEQTDALIAKQQRIKTGLMQDLLTRGIDDNGNLRSEETHTFKASPLGRIPEEWDYIVLDSRLESIEQGWSPDCDNSPATQGQWGVLKTTAVVWSGYQYRENKVLPPNLKPRPQYEVKPGDLLMTRGGPNSRVGVVAYVYETQPRLMISDKLYRLNTDETVNKEFLSSALSSSQTQRHLSTLKTGLAESQTNISQKIVRQLGIALPSEPEQQKIAEILRNSILQAESNVTCLAKLLSLKTALMQDLLTGKVRVTPLLKESQEAIV